LCGSLQKDRASPLRQAQRAGEKGWGFLQADGCPAELPVMNFQVKPDRFQPIFLLIKFSNYFSNKIDFHI
jgi:hypothetical protein